jgi:phosphoserine aminotransferase
MNRIFFTPGPSQLYFTVQDHLKTALRENVPAISHRSAAFKKIMAETTEAVRELLQVPNDHYILYPSSANEAWERIIENTVEKSTLHLVNGAFSERFANIASALGKKVEAYSVEWGQGIDASHISLSQSFEHIACTHNETSTGASMDPSDWNRLRELFPDSLISLDVVSSAPFPEIPFNIIDSSYFSVQKCFGLPSGLGVWTVNDQMVEKARTLQEKGVSIGSYHALPGWIQKAKDHQTPETPNMLGIYLLGQVARDMLSMGIERIRRDTNYKAALMYQMAEQHDLFKPFVQDPGYRSKTVIVLTVEGDSRVVIDKMRERGLVLGDGYGKFKGKHIRIANFPAQSNEQYEMLVDALKAFN